MLTLGPPRHDMTCSGCGQRPEGFAPLDAVAEARVLQRRCESLLRHPEVSLRRRGPQPGSWSAMEPAARVSDALGIANHRLRELLGEEGVPPNAPIGSPTPHLAPWALLASLAENVSHLTATIDGATAEDWYRPRPDGPTARQLVWLALHDAIHHLEDAELLGIKAALAATTQAPR